jgi:hypothetical protein
VIEVLVLVGKIVFEVLLETIPHWNWGSSGRKYRTYVHALPPGETPLTRRQWRAAEQSNDTS